MAYQRQTVEKPMNKQRNIKDNTSFIKRIDRRLIVNQAAVDCVVAYPTPPSPS